MDGWMDGWMLTDHMVHWKVLTTADKLYIVRQYLIEGGQIEVALNSQNTFELKGHMQVT